MQSALLIIDFQNAIFTPPAAWQAELVLERIQKLIARARQAGMPVVYVQHDEVDTVWEHGSQTWQFPVAIAPLPGDFVSPKQHSSAFQNSHFQANLAERGIHKIFVCGYATEFCLDSNIRQAASLNIETVVVADAHTTRNRPHMEAPKIIEHHNWIWSEIGQITLMNADDLPF